jgi:hypothetical protein
VLTQEDAFLEDYVYSVVDSVLSNNAINKHEFTVNYLLICFRTIVSVDSTYRAAASLIPFHRYSYVIK